MMTLESAIKYCEEVAEEQEKLCKVNDSFNFSQPRWRECAEEHRQLAKWLKELKNLKEKAEPQFVRYVQDGLAEDDCIAYCPNCDELLNDYWNCGYCPCCGQALEW
jgi:hypothetical protein